ncbi:MAG: dipeptide/oligopeptide/nickel ABC transporter permease/ATP-binding protein [Acidimicrobiia bacterium]
MTDAISTVEEIAPRQQSAGVETLRSLTRRPSAVVGVIGATIVLVSALGAPLIAPYDPAAQDLTQSLLPPIWDGGSPEHLLGTDALGRDTASRLLFGARNSLLISVGAMLLASLLGLATGITAGFFGGRLDAVLMRLGDIQLAFPFILLAISILGTLPGRNVGHMILVLGIPGWIVYARVVRSRVISEKQKEYVLAAKAVGASGLRRLRRYVLPSVWQVIPVIAFLDVGFLVITESTLSFLGLGLPPPASSWGLMLAEGRKNLLISPWLSVLPGLAILVTVLSINLVGDGLADVLDPRLRKGTFLRRPLKGRPSVGSADDDVVLSVRDLAVEFPLRRRVIRAVRNVSFDVRRGETLGVVGESGSGKSVTALSIIQLLDAPGRVTSGGILFDGRDLARIPDREMRTLRGSRIGMIFQNPVASLNPVLSIGQQMAESMASLDSMRGQDDTAASVRALRSVGIGDPERILRQYPFQLSGGMNQRVVIAMAMAAQPDLLIADEPTTALDVTTQAQILDELREVTTRQNTSLILITHDIALVAERADTILVMYAGQVAEYGPANRIVSEPSHPYTRALLESAPRADLESGVELQAIRGELPDPATVPPGCPFAPRCPSVMDICHRVNPPAFSIGHHHWTACHLWSPEVAEVSA